MKFIVHNVKEVRKMKNVIKHLVINYQFLNKLERKANKVARNDGKSLNS